MSEHLNPTVWKLLPASAATDNARADQAARWQAGKPLPVEKYLDALPRVAADPELAMVLIYGEVLSRTERGETPTLNEYRRRFPQFADHLAIQFQLHSALGKESAPATNPADRTRPLAEGAGGDPLPDRFGPFRVLEVIGRGGKGVVLAADDPTLNRVVAIKTLRPGFVRAEAAARFAREARISAKVQHPSVPPVYAVGELPDGTPYLAMKRVRGRTLAELLLERSSPSADLPALLRTFEQVCQAVGFAHATGIIHRDLKPANVMVGEFGEVQVMDWGLAKELGTADFVPTDPADDDQGTVETRRGTVLGTPAYMAPEQARGEPTDRRADVFALGAILCELLTGHPPYSGRSAVDVLAKAAAADMKSAGKRLAECGADADLVALAERCLQPIRDNRPANGAEVAVAIAKYHAATDDRLRAAERAKAAAEVQVVEQKKRRRVQFALAAAVTAVLVIGGVSAWVVQKQNTDRELEETKQTAERTERRVRAVEAVDRGIAQATELRKRSLWKQADAALTQAEAAAADADDPDRPAMLTAARKELTLLRDLDAARLDRVFWQGKRGQKAESDKRYAGLFADHGFDVTGGDPDELAGRIRTSPIKAELLSALDDWAFGADTKETADKVLAVAKAVAGQSWRDVVNKKRAEHENPPKARDLLRVIPPADRTPALFLALSRSTTAGADAPTILREGLDQFHSDFWLVVELAMTHEQWNEHGPAVIVFGTARALRPDSWQLLNEMGVVCQKMGDRPAAMRLYRQSLALRESATTFSNLGNTLRDDGKLDEAISMHQRATKADPTYANAWTNLGVALRDKGVIDDAVTAFRTAISLDPDDAAPRFNLGLALLSARNDPKGAIAEFEPIVERDLKMVDDEKGRVFTAWAHALSLLERWIEAEDKVRTALKANANHAESHYILAEILCGQEKPNDAIPEYKEAIRLDPKRPQYYLDLGVELRKQGDVDEAIDCYEKAIKLDPDDFKAHLNLGTAHFSRKDYTKAEVAFRKAVELDKSIAEGHFNLGLALAGLRKYDEAEAALKQAVRRDERMSERTNPVLAAIRAERKAGREVLPPPRPADDGK